MAGAVNPTTKFLGLNPAQDPRQYQGPTVLACQNVLVDIEGPVSAFGEELISEAVIENPENAFTFRVEDFSVLATTGVILGYDQVSQYYYPLFEFDDADENFPWSMAQCGDVYYFAKKGVDGLISYDAVGMFWDLQSGGTIPDDIYGVCASFGRLVIISDGLVSWSAIDDGTDLAASSTTGAGFQALAVVGQGKPLSVNETDAGFIATTKTGVANFVAVTSYPVFRYERIKTRELPINPYCVVNVEQGTVVWLSKAGFRITNGKAPEVWQPLFGEFFTQKIFPFLGEAITALPTLFRMTFNEDRQWFMISTANTTNPLVYFRCFVLYIPSEQWGSFDERHYGFGELDLTIGANAGFNFGYVDENKQLKKFQPLPYREQSVLGYDDTTVFSQPNFDFPVRGIGPNAYIFPCNMRIDTQTFANFNPNISAVYYFTDIDAGDETADFYIIDPDVTGDGLGIDWLYSLEPDEDWLVDTIDEDWLLTQDLAMPAVMWMGTGFAVYAYQIVPRQLASINSSVTIGLYRITDQQYADRLSQYNNIMLGTDTNSVFAPSEDWFVSVEPDEDWLISSMDEDWGFEPPTANNFDIFWQGTIDGQNTFEENEGVPEEIYRDGSSVYCSFTFTGLWHKFTLNALNTNQSFHLKTAEPAGILAGRLYA